MAMPTPTPLCARYNHYIARCYAFAIFCCCFVLGPKHFPFSIVSCVSLNKRCLLNVLENVIHFLLPPLLLLLLVPLHIFITQNRRCVQCWRKKNNYTMKKFYDEQCKITYTNKMCSSAGFQAFSIIIEWYIH